MPEPLTDAQRAALHQDLLALVDSLREATRATEAVALQALEVDDYGWCRKCGQRGRTCARVRPQAPNHG